MRIPVPKHTLVTLTLVGAFLTAALTAGLAHPDAVDGLRTEAARALSPDDAAMGDARAAGISGGATADVRSRPTTPSHRPTASPQPTARPQPAASPTASAPVAQQSTPQATPEPPTPNPNFTPEVQTVTSGSGGGREGGEAHEQDGHEGSGSRGYEGGEHEGGEHEGGEHEGGEHEGDD
ncbi:MAG: hypothetical protein ABEJ28_00400 [Salinigranum sp.]